MLWWMVFSLGFWGGFMAVHVAFFGIGSFYTLPAIANGRWMMDD